MSGPRLSIIPAGAVIDRSLEPRDLQVLCLLGRHTDKAGWCVRSQVKMAAEIDCGRSSVQRSLERLVDAGWVEKKRRDAAADTADPGQPSASYAYRVVLDRDDFAFENATGEAAESHAENALEGAECPPVGTPSEAENTATVSDENATEGAQEDGHPGAHPGRAGGAHVEMGTKNVPSERPLLERERDARATKDRKARFLVAFEARWPTAAADNRQRTAYAAGELTEEEETAALAGIAGFLENQKRLGRKNVPAGWRYLEEKRWTLLEQPKEAPHAAAYPRDSIEAKALAVLHDIAGKGDFFRQVHRRSDGTVSYSKPVTAQLAALSQAPERAEWVELNRQQAGAWEGFLREAVAVTVRKHLREGDRAPWPWPPSAEGKIYTTGPPETLMSAEDFADFK
jgi:hypothetical protein